MRRVRGRTGLALPVLGLGTWRMGERPDERRREVAALRLGLDLGVTLIDTAEMYGDGGAEQVVGEAIRGRRDAVQLVSKVLPDNASYRGTLAAAERSLRRLETDRIDLYLLHWPGAHPLVETYRAFRDLVDQGKVLHYGLSNFDVDDLLRSEAISGGAAVAANQVLYNLERRAVERRLLPLCREAGILAIAYSPFEQARLRPRTALRAIAARRGCSPYRIALAWTLRESGVVAIPKALAPQHVRDNVAAATLELSAEELNALDDDHPRPETDRPLEVL